MQMDVFSCCWKHETSRIAVGTVRKGDSRQSLLPRAPRADVTADGHTASGWQAAPTPAMMRTPALTITLLTLLLSVSAVP
jgi:hypothetical protein